ncbi:hypothetical protein GCM10007877_01010 [Marinibactrum halimedae]|uniref:Uncharacterized protein n=2 Tax=Marinibactrum halimedae TaxID=1444977 RepID=A0AA37T0D6_9GAMM|nr:hypothetical protein GCM10007877_01010 [Marinibactrum halimedae]
MRIKIPILCVGCLFSILLHGQSTSIDQRYEQYLESLTSKAEELSTEIGAISEKNESLIERGAEPIFGSAAQKSLLIRGQSVLGDAERTVNAMKSDIQGMESNKKLEGCRAFISNTKGKIGAFHSFLSQFQSLKVNAGDNATAFMAASMEFTTLGMLASEVSIGIFNSCIPYLD